MEDNKTTPEEQVVEQPATETQVEEPKVEKERKTFDSAELDRRITQATEKVRNEWEEKSKALVQKAVEDTKLTESERYERDLKEREEMLQQKEKQLNDTERMARAKSLLADNGLSTSFANTVFNSADMEAEITSLKNEIERNVNSRIESERKENMPKASGTSSENVGFTPWTPENE